MLLCVSGLKDQRLLTTAVVGKMCLFIPFVTLAKNITSYSFLPGIRSDLSSGFNNLFHLLKHQWDSTETKALKVYWVGMQP